MSFAGNVGGYYILLHLLFGSDKNYSSFTYVYLNGIVICKYGFSYVIVLLTTYGGLNKLIYIIGLVSIFVLISTFVFLFHYVFLLPNDYFPVMFISSTFWFVSEL